MGSSGLEQIPITSQKHDPAWKHCEMFKNGERVQLKCSYCGKLFKGGGIHRIKEHLAGQKGNAATCPRSPPDVRAHMQRSLDGVVVKKRNRQKLDQEIINIENNKAMIVECIEPVSSLVIPSSEPEPGTARKRSRARDSGSTSVHMAIGRFLCDIGAPLESVNSPYFEPMITAVGGSVSPSCYQDLRGWVLKSLVNETRTDVEKHRGVWEKMGCSVFVEEQRTAKSGRTILNLTVNCPEGTVFLRTAEISPDLDSLYETLRSAVEEIGPTNVVQVVTNSNKESHSVAGKKLIETFPSLFWAPCSVHLIDSILEEFANLDWISEVIEQARSVARFVYNHSEVLNMVRRFTFGNDIIEPGLTRYSTSFSTIKRLLDLRHNLQAVVTSPDWAECPSLKNPDGLKFSDIFMNDSFWSSCGVVVNLTSSLLRVLRILSNEKKAAMGFIYAAMYRVKEAIKKELVKREDYLVYWEIIDQRWEFHHRSNSPLHAAGFYLNPRFFYCVEGDLLNDIRSGVFDCIERLVPDPKVQDKIIKEMGFYKNAAGDFGRKIAIRTRETLLPAEWWSTYGGGCPNLSRLAIRILSQNCSSVRCNNRNLDLIRRVHDSGNSLEQQRLSDLVFVHNNLGLRKMTGKSNGQDFVDPISSSSSDGVCVVEDWIGRLEDGGDSDWMAIDPPLTNMLLMGPANDDAEDLGTGFEDCEIFSRDKDAKMTIY